MTATDTSRKKAVITLIALHLLVLKQHSVLFSLLRQFLVGTLWISMPCVLSSLAILPKANTSIWVMILAKAIACQWISASSASMALCKLLVNIIFSVVKCMVVLAFNVFTLMCFFVCYVSNIKSRPQLTNEDLLNGKFLNMKFVPDKMRVYKSCSDPVAGMILVMYVDKTAFGITVRNCARIWEVCQDGWAHQLAKGRRAWLVPFDLIFIL